jgi:hypothetical protein
VIGAASKLKRGTGRDAHVVLVPQPSDDPNDPYVSYSFNYLYLNHYQHRLNWPRWKKEACFWTLYIVLSAERPLPNKLITIQGIHFKPGRCTRAHGRPRLFNSVGRIRGKRRRSGVLLWINLARTRILHVSTLSLLSSINYLTRNILGYYRTHWPRNLDFG